MSFLRSPAGQASLLVGMFTALLVGVLATLSLPTVAAWALVVGVWIVAVTATLLTNRLTGFRGSSRDWPRAGVVVLAIVIAVFVFTVKMLEGALDVRPGSALEAALSGGLTFGSATMVGNLAASFLAKRKGDQALDSKRG